MGRVFQSRNGMTRGTPEGKYLCGRGTRKQLGVAKGVSRKGQEMTDEAKPWGPFQIKIHPKGEEEPPEGLRQEYVMVRFVF